MSINVIIERIAAALGSGELRTVPDSFNFQPVSTIVDLLRPWEEMSPGVTRDDDKDTRSIYSVLRQPVFVPQVRTSRRPLGVPTRIAASPKSISPALFASIQGIWEFYQLRELADPELLQRPFNSEGMAGYLGPLEFLLRGFYPLSIPLEMVLEEYSPEDIPGIQLMLPCWTYEVEGADVVEAFLSGADGVHSLLSHYQKEMTDLSDKDAALITTVGLEKLIEAYAKYPGGKSYDLDKLADWYEVFFSGVRERFPEHMKNDYMVISGDSGYDNHVTITRAVDIEFCIAYFYAFDSMSEAIPYPYDFSYNQAGEMDTFVHEICNVWRRQTGKRPVKWESPKLKTLANVFKEDKQ